MTTVRTHHPTDTHPTDTRPTDTRPTDTRPTDTDTHPADTHATDEVTVRLAGLVDARSTAQVREELRTQLALHDRVVVDLADVHGIDLTALRVLAAASHQASREGHHLVLRGCGPAVRRLLHVSHLIRAVEVERTALGA